MKFKILFLLFLLTLIPLVLAKPWNQYIHIPDNYAKFPNLLYFIFIPFVGTFVIAWGIFHRLNIFDFPKVDLILAILFAISLLYYGFMLKLSQFLYSFGGFFAVVVFFIVFAVATVRFGKTKTGEWGAKANEMKRLMEAQKDLAKLEKKLIKLEEEKIRKEHKGDKKSVETIEKEIEKRKDTVTDLKSKIEELMKKIPESKEATEETE